MIVRGVPIPEVVGPERQSPAALLNPEATSSTHPIIRVMTEVLGTFAHVDRYARKDCFHVPHAPHHTSKMFLGYALYIFTVL